MSVQLKCPHCGYTAAIPNSYAGKEGKCPQCRALIRAAVARRPAADGAAGLAPNPPTPCPPSPAARRPAPSPQRVNQPTEIEPPPADELSWLASDALPPSRSGEFSGARRGQKTPGGRRIPAAAWAGLGVSTILIAAAVAFQLGRGDRRQPDRAVADGTASPDTAAGKPLASDGTPKPDVDSASVNWVDVFPQVEPGIVKLEISKGGQRIGVGSGFVVDRSGLVATNYHVVSPGDAATALFTDGRKVEVAGYHAVRPDCDLAIVRLADPPADLRVLKLRHADQPRKASPVMAVGSPLDHAFVPTSGMVGRVIRAWELPQQARAFLRFQTGQEEQIWIEHSAQINPGNSGGPLFNYQGEVIGINTWVDREAQFGFALWAWYIHDLLQNPLAETAPLSKYQRDAGEGREQIVDQPPSTMLPPIVDLTPASLQAAFDACDSAGWQPASAEEYKKLQRLAYDLVAIKLAVESPHRGELDPTANRLLAALGAVAWDSGRHFAPINRLGSDVLEETLSGAMLFVRLLGKLPAGYREQDLYVFDVLGTDRSVCVPYAADAAAPAADTTYVLLGLVSGSALRVQSSLAPNKRPEYPLFDRRILLPLPHGG